MNTPCIYHLKFKKSTHCENPVNGQGQCLPNAQKVHDHPNQRAYEGRRGYEEEKVGAWEDGGGGEGHAEDAQYL